MITKGSWSRRNRFNVQWMLGNFCNYKCSYCPPRLRDGALPFVTLDLAKRVVDNILRQKPDHNVLFSFQGGEVTLWKDFENLIKYIYEQGGSSLLATNGSRSVAYFERIAPYLNYTFISFHESSKIEKSLERIKVFDPTRVASYTLMNPDLWDKCVDAHEQITAAGYRSIARIVFDDYCTLDTAQIGYTQAQRDYIDHANKNILDPKKTVVTWPIVKALPYKFKGKPDFTLDSRVIQIFENGEERRTSAQNLLATQKNDYRGFNCYAGIEGVCIGGSGGVTSSVCLQDGVYADIYENPEFELPTAPMSCTRKSCWCEADLMTTKISPDEPTFDKTLVPNPNPKFRTARSDARIIKIKVASEVKPKEV